MNQDKKTPIAVLISGNGSNLQAIIDAQPSSHYEVKLVLSNRPNAYGLQRAEKADIPTVLIDHTQYDSREQFDAAVVNALQSAHIDLVVLAGFMRILTPVLVKPYLGKMLNIHPSLLPKYPGLHTHQRALEAGDPEHGLSIHFVTEELDGGPVILQARTPIEAQDTPETLQQKVHQLEHIAYPKVIDLVAQNSIQYQDGQVYFHHQPLTTPLDLNQLK